ncbi:MAG: RHS repeat-associated core domain-containing protein [Candidatus Omnitrophota bacterium]
MNKLLHKTISIILCIIYVINFSFNGLTIAQASVESASVASSGAILPGGASSINFSTNSFQTDLFRGNASYSVPIEVPPGRQGIAPQLNLSYSSQPASGWCGVGWDLSLGSITRSLKNGLPKYDTTDTFLYNGSELKNIGGNEYRLKTDGPYMKFINNTDHWLVYDKAGTQYRYNSTINTPSGVFQWSLVRVTDLHGNYMSVTYTLDQGQAYPQQILYTGNDAISAVYEVDFVLEDRTDKIVQHLIAPIHNPSGAPAVYTCTTAKRLKEIQVKLSGSLIRKYILSYHYSNVTSRSLLDGVTLYGEDGTTHFNPITFEYEETIPQIQGTTAIDYTTNWGTPLMGDFNGDGITDICIALYEDLRVHWGNADGTFTFAGVLGHFPGSDAGISYLSTGDFNGDGYTDIFNLLISGDINATPTYSLLVYLSTGSSFATGAVWYSDTRSPVPDPVTPVGGIPYSYDRVAHVLSCDINKDGKTDIIIADELNTSNFGIVTPDITTKLYTSIGSNFVDGGLEGIISSGVHSWYMSLSGGDFNGDGYMDMLIGHRGTNWMYAKVVLYPYYFSENAYTPPVWQDNFLMEDGILPVDVNYDGYCDLVRFYESQGNWDVAYSDGAGFNYTVGDTWCPSFGQYKTPLAGNFGTSSVTTPGTFRIEGLTGQWQFGTATPSDQRADYLIDVDNGVGGSVQITYKQHQEAGLPFIHYIVDEVTKNDGMGNSYTSTYDFSGASYDREDKEFRGFNYVKVTDPEGSYSETYFHQGDDLKGKPYLVQTKNSSGTLCNKKENTWSSNNNYAGQSGLYEINLSQEDSTVYEGSYARHTRVSYEYDGYGNVTHVYSLGDVNVSGDEKHVYNYYVYNTSSWILGCLARTIICDNQSNEIAKQWFYYDNNSSFEATPIKGLLTKQESWLDGSTNPATTYTYDAYGNMLSVTDSRQNTTTTEYDSSYHFFPIKITNALNQEISYTYEPKTAQVLTTTDVNGQVTINYYDDLWRLVKVVGPDDNTIYPSVEYQYDLNTTPTKITTLSKISESEYLTTYAFYDGVGKCIQTKSPSATSGMQIVSGPTTYNSRGLVEEQYFPFEVTTSTSYTSPQYSTQKTTYEYDDLGRVISVTAPDGTVSEVEFAIEPTTDYSYITNYVKYSGSTLAQSTSYFDAYGQLAIKRECNNNGAELYYTYYTYDPVGNLVQVKDHQNNITTISYDTLGRKTSMNDPDMGIWSYTYDAAGNLITQTDAESQVITFTYDNLNRLTQKNYSTGGAIIYTYDDATSGRFGKGRLCTVNDFSGTTDFYYDKLGREVKSEKTVSSTAYTVERTYDGLNRLKEVTYPNAEVVQYNYDTSGAIASIYSVTNAAYYVTDIDYDKFSQMTHLGLGNGTYTDYNYNANTRRLSSLTTNSGAVQDLLYDFDNLGNVTQITDSRYGTQQTFQYDNISRLTQAIGNNYGTIQYQYDAIGNITSKTISGEQINYTYGQNGAGPHAVTTYGNIDMDYDDNGNMTSKADTAMTYDIENRLKTVVDSPGIPSSSNVTINLSVGWNMISMPVDPVNPNIAVVLTDIAGKYDQVSRYNSTTCEFEHYIGNPNYDDFDEFEFGKGYEIYVTEACSLTLSGAVPKNNKVNLKTGINLIANPKFSSTDTEDALKTMIKGMDYDTVYKYNNASETFTDVTDQQLDPGVGYFVNILRDVEWTVNRHLGTTTYTYDGDGGRVKKQVVIPNDGTYITTYIGSLFEKQETPGGTKTINHVYLGGTKVASVESTGTTLYTHGDHLGSSNVITDQTGAVIQHTEYDPFGKVVLDERTGSDGTEYKFTGKELDSNQLYYYGARYYDAELCRFITPDSIVPETKNPQSFNRYSYCDNNPVNYTDPTGHAKLRDVLGTVVGAIVGIAVFIGTGGNFAAAFKAFSMTKSVVDGAVAIEQGADPGRVLASVGLNIALNIAVPGGDWQLGNAGMNALFHAGRGALISGTTSHIMGGKFADGAKGGAIFGGIGGFLDAWGPTNGSGGKNGKSNKTDQQAATVENDPNPGRGGNTPQEKSASIGNGKRNKGFSVDLKKAEQIGLEVLSDNNGWNDAGDAYRHALWNKRMVEEINLETALVVGAGYELKATYLFPIKQPIHEMCMDLWNNFEGINAGLQNRPINRSHLIHFK